MTALPDQTENETLPLTMMRPLRRAFGMIVLGVAAFCAWAVMAPLATTIHASGHLKATSPTYDLQHPVGGRIDQVLVRDQQTVVKGQTLFRLDVSVDQAHLVQTEMQIETLQAENALIAQILENPATVSKDPQDWISARIAAKAAAHRGQTQAGTSRVSAFASQITGLSGQLDLNRQREGILKDRLRDQRKLAKRGAVPARDVGIIQDKLLSLQSQIAGQVSRRAALLQDRTQAELSLAQTRRDFESHLLDLYVANEKHLPELQKRAIDLRNRLALADVRAPMAGTVVNLAFDTHDMFAPRGETLVTLVRETGEYEVSFNISPQQIDQVATGMSGFVMLTSLPQRNLPKVSATITALSPQAKRNNDGAVVGYEGRARLNAADVEKVKSAVGSGVRLSNDMPVGLTFEGRRVTFADYLVAPFLVFLTKSLQD